MATPSVKQSRAACESMWVYVRCGWGRTWCWLSEAGSNEAAPTSAMSLTVTHPAAAWPGRFQHLLRMYLVGFLNFHINTAVNKYCLEKAQCFHTSYLCRHLNKLSSFWNWYLRRRFHVSEKVTILIFEAKWKHYFNMEKAPVGVFSKDCVFIHM